MKQFSWLNLSESLKLRVTDFVDETLRILKNKNIVGIYLHGSLAMGCFNPEHSDVDILIVIEKAMNVQEKFSFAKMVLKISKNPIPLELSILKLDDFRPWKYPTPFEFHYSEDWRDKYDKELKNSDWQKWNDKQRTDPDLAAHITVTYHRGTRLYGKDIKKVFPKIPFSDYLDSIARDVVWALNENMRYKNPVYLILNYCRVLAAAREKKVLSKYEGGEWGLKNLPRRFGDIIHTAMKIYAGEEVRKEFDQKILDEFINYSLFFLDLEQI